MDNENTKLPKAKNITWEWPVKLYISNSLDLEFQNSRSLKTLSYYDIVKPEKSHLQNFFFSNILLFKGYKEALIFFEGSPQTQITNTDIIIIIEEKNFLGKNKELIPLSQFAKLWTKRTEAGGLYFIHSDLKIPEWYDGFMTELSQNKGVVEAIEASDAEILQSYISPNLNTKTKLSDYLTKIGKRTGSPSFPRNEKFKINIPGFGSKTMHSRELSAFIKKNSSNFSYDLEGELANSITDISYSVNNVNAELESAKLIEVVPEDKGEYQTKPSGPRYLRASVYNKKDKSFANKYLLPQTSYQLWVNIGYKDISHGWTIADQKIEVEKIFEDKKLKKINIDLVISFKNSKELHRKSITLPREGESSIAKIDFTTSTKKAILEAKIGAYYKGKKIHEVLYRIPVGQSNNSSFQNGPELKTSVILKNLDNLSQQSLFSASITIEKNGKKNSLTTFQKRKSENLTYTNSLKVIIDRIKELIERGALMNNPAALEDPDNITLFIQLANNGYLLYQQFLKEIKLDGPLQLLSNREEYIPIDFAYTLKPPTRDASLCTHAKEALEKGKCCGCLKTQDEEYNTICPFGFWGLSQVIERHQFPKDLNKEGSDFILRFEPDDSRPSIDILKKMMYASTERVDAAVPGSYDKMKNTLNHKAHETPVEIKSWIDWENTIPVTDPDTLILIVHVENDDIAAVDALEIASGDFLPMTHFDERYLNTNNYKSQPPFVILIGCETVNTNAYLFDTVSFIIRKGAAMVLSNFTKITGEAATVIVSELVEILRSEAGKSKRFGEIVLRLRQRLLAKGMMMALTLLAHGDADWKIKIAK
ncbi:hypothetical protein [Chryseobacterium limigenitum]|uniref:CHAT domain-containing protein n=1 Tax=Chryseobacterium limigenitum TaxID=1612149 RepID=A0A1K2IGN1_9FLAO|nr:hypothetical protein [Chryseobacterium limigenitum]SFZ91585.1 hypothetical protein SAMN05216324_102421 [Chryseobacterium limigenitum]